MEELLIAPCGMNCSVCSFYLAEKNNLRNTGFTTPYCPGCRPRGRNCINRKMCESLKNGEIRLCYECDNFPCNALEQLDKNYKNKYHMSMIKNLNYIKDHGIGEFMNKERKKWECPDCGGIICCHNGVCYTCGTDKLDHPRPKSIWTSNSTEVSTESD